MPYSCQVIDNIWTDEFIVMIEDGKQKIFDRSIFSLADGLSQEETDTFTVTGFKEGDNIILRNGGKRDTLVIRSVAHDTTGDILECEPFNTKNEYTPGSIVETSDKKIRSFTLTNVPANSNNSLLKVAIIEKGETIILGLKDDPSRTDAIEITEVDDRVEKIFIDDNYLVYSGTHSINRNSINNNNSKNNNEDNKLLFPFLVNINSKEIHNLDNIKKNCNLDYIKNDHKKFIKTLDNINGYDYCGWCFGAGMSKR
jgi:hypothetical protein